MTADAPDTIKLNNVETWLAMFLASADDRADFEQIFDAAVVAGGGNRSRVAQMLLSDFNAARQLEIDGELERRLDVLISWLMAKRQGLGFFGLPVAAVAGAMGAAGEAGSFFGGISSIGSALNSVTSLLPGIGQIVGTVGQIAQLVGGNEPNLPQFNYGQSTTAQGAAAYARAAYATPAAPAQSAPPTSSPSPASSGIPDWMKLAAVGVGVVLFVKVLK